MQKTYLRALRELERQKLNESRQAAQDLEDESWEERYPWELPPEARLPGPEGNKYKTLLEASLCSPDPLSLAEDRELASLERQEMRHIEAWFKSQPPGTYEKYLQRLLPVDDLDRAILFLKSKKLSAAWSRVLDALKFSLKLSEVQQEQLQNLCLKHGWDYKQVASQIELHERWRQ